MREPTPYARNSNVGSSRDTIGTTSGSDGQGKKQGHDRDILNRSIKTNQAAACEEHTVVRSDNHGTTITHTLVMSQESGDNMMTSIEMNVGDHFNDPPFNQGCGDVEMFHDVVPLDDHQEVGLDPGV